jgi:tritrans,polycis-undecaprenyl-diphosphate synthase [geranylgeranyl-diphosphate specific]
MLRHLGLILDGNRRFARELLRKPWEGHKMGLATALNALQWSCEAGIKHITAYILSYENFRSRPKRELNYILKYLGEECDRVLLDPTHVVNRFNIKVRFIGRLTILPKWLQKKTVEVENATKHYTKHVLNLALAYGGQQEIADAVRKISEKAMKGIISPAAINPLLVQHHLYTNGQPPPDLILRTGGEKRLSNFLTYQSAYSELVFMDKRWPELKKSDFNRAINDFEKRQRRFGR